MLARRPEETQRPGLGGVAGVVAWVPAVAAVVAAVLGTVVGVPVVVFAEVQAVNARAGSSEPIREWGFAVTMTGGPITTRAWHLIRDWNQEWQALGRPELPSLWDRTRVQCGERALKQLAGEVHQAQTPEAAPDDTDLCAKVVSAWRPPTTVHPPATWVSQVGDPWARMLWMSR
jgi:hypothetical protein